MNSTSDTNDSVLEPNQSLAQVADNDLTIPDPSTDHTVEFATATSSREETDSQAEPAIAFDLRSRTLSMYFH